MKSRMKWIAVFIFFFVLDGCASATAREQTATDTENARHEGTLTAIRGNLKVIPHILVKAGAPTSFNQIAGRIVVISPHDLPGDLHFYEVTGGAVQITGGGTLVLNVECGSKFREGTVRELVFKFGRWSIAYYTFDPQKQNRLERDEEPVELW